MGKKRNYIAILAVVTAVFLVGVLFDIHVIREFYLAVFAHMTASDVIIIAALVGFVFVGNKHYWLIVLGSAVVASIFIQLVLVGNGFVGYLILTRIVAFIAIVFALNCAKIFINK